MFHYRIAVIIVLARMVAALTLNAQILAEHPTSSASRSSASSDQNQDSATTRILETAPLMTRLTPHPYIYVGPSLMGAGYAPFAIRVEGGLNVESTHLSSQAGAAFDNGRQVNDGDQPNPKGHDCYLDAAIYFRPAWRPLPSQAFFGFGWRWSQLWTTNYTKSANRPQIGGGYDFLHPSCSDCGRDFSMRIAIDWVMAGNDWQNGSHGSDITISLPSPREQRHWFWQERVGIYRFHKTVTDKANISLALSQRADRSLACYVTFGIMYRF